MVRIADLKAAFVFLFVFESLIFFPRTLPLPQSLSGNFFSLWRKKMTSEF